MANIDTSGLEKWPDADKMAETAADIVKKADDYQTKVGDTKTELGRVQGPGVLSFPGVDPLYSSLDCTDGWASAASHIALLVGVNLGSLAGQIQGLKDRRDQLQAEADYANAQPAVMPPDASEPVNPNDPWHEMQRLQQQVNEVADAFSSAVNDCYAKLWAIQKDGTSSIPSQNSLLEETLKQNLRDRTVDAVKTATWSVTRETVVKINGEWSTFMGHRFGLPDTAEASLNVSLADKYKFDFSTSASQGYAADLVASLKDSMMMDKASATLDLKAASAEMEDAVSKSGAIEAELLRTESHALAGTSRALLALGIYLDAKDEFDARDTLLRHQDPNMSDLDRVAQDSKAAVVRAGANTAVAAYATAAVTPVAVDYASVLLAGEFGAEAGSVVPGLGTVVGLGVGIVVGLALTVPIFDGKSLSGMIGDGAEWAVDHAADAVKSVGSAVVDGGKKLWHSIFG